MIIIQLLKDTKYPTNYQIIIDSSLGNYAVLRDFFSALHEDMVVLGLCGRVPDSAGNVSLHGLHLLGHSKSVGPPAPIAYATSVSPPDEAAAWPRAQVSGAG